MEFNFKQLVAELNISPISADVLYQITLLLEQQSDKPFHSLLILQQWAWQLLSQNSHQWINQPGYQELFRTLASFNKNLIFTDEDIEADDKASLLFPVTVDQINCIFKQIESTNDDNDLFIKIVSLWFDNHSYFIDDNPHCNVLAITDFINQYILHNYVMNEQFQFYLTQLQQSPLASSVFTAKMLFYIKTSSFSLHSYIGVRAHSFPCTLDEMLRYIGDDYLRIIHIHSRTVASWSKELLTCLTHLISFIARCYWWDGQIWLQAKILFHTEQTVCGHVQDLIDIIAYEPFQKQIKAVPSNDETILIHATLQILFAIVQTQNVNWFFRASPMIQNVLTSIAKTSLYDGICICGYGLVAEVLTDEQLKNLKINETIGGFFFNMLEHAWHHASKKYKQIAIEDLLRGKCVVELSTQLSANYLFLEFFSGYSKLSRHDFIQQNTADMNKIPILIEISEQYPIVYDIFWALSFNQDIQQQLRSSSTFMSKLAHFAKEIDNEQMRKITHGILWNLEIDHEDRSTLEINDGKAFDVMISYSHKDKEFCKQLYEELIKAGYRVWIDFDQMHGNVMDAMAQAIERSQTVIICMSEDYRKSNYCRAEAHYAFQRQRKIVPVLSQKHYKADGWLLFLIGQLLYVDFTKYEFDRALKMLLKELRESDTSEINPVPTFYKEQIHIAVPIMPASSRRPSIIPILPQNILDWTQADVQNWLVGHKFIQMPRLLVGCDGRSLVYLSKYMKYSELRHNLNSFREDSLRRLNENLSMIELSRFQTLLDQQSLD